MGRLLTGSINLMKIDKSKIQTHDKFGQPFKNGNKYLNISIWVEDPNVVDQFGNIASVSTGTSAEDRVYLGNLKEYLKKPTTEATTIADAPTVPADAGDDLPF